MSVQSSPEEVVRKFFDCYTDGRPEDLGEIVTPDYLDYGHAPPWRGPGGARDDYEHAVKVAGGMIRYTIDMLVVDGDMVAVAWTGTPPNGDEIKGLSLYRTSDGMIRSTRRALTGNLAAWPNALFYWPLLRIMQKPRPASCPQREERPTLGRTSGKTLSP